MVDSPSKKQTRLWDLLHSHAKWFIMNLLFYDQNGFLDFYMLTSPHFLACVWKKSCRVLRCNCVRVPMDLPLTTNGTTLDKNNFPRTCDLWPLVAIQKCGLMILSHINTIVGFFISVSSLKVFGHSIHSERRSIYLGKSIQALQSDTIIISWVFSFRIIQPLVVAYL